MWHNRLAHCPDKAGVAGSIPAVPIFKRMLVQLAKTLPPQGRKMGSSPIRVIVGYRQMVKAAGSDPVIVSSNLTSPAK